jgi:hypothetical protein
MRSLLRTIRILVLCSWLLAAAVPVTPAAAQGPLPDPRFGVVQAYVNADAANEAGVGYSRIIMRWDLIQPASIEDWKPANVPDPFIEAELAAGREVVAVLMGTPAWASADGSDSPKAVPNMSYWERFVRRMAQQYQGRITHWIIWNEPDVWDPDHPGSTWNGTEADYFQLLKTAYLAIKDVDPTMQIHLAGLTYFWDQQYDKSQYLARLLDQILTDPEAPQHGYYFDAVVYHLYYKPFQAPTIIGEVESILGERGIMAKEIWINETNAPPSDDPQELPRMAPRYEVSLAEQASFVIQEFSLAFAAGANRVEFYKMRDETEYDSEPYGMLRLDDSRRPVYDAFKIMTTYLRDFQAVQWETFGEVQVVTFDRGDATTTVLWTVGRSSTNFTLHAIAPTALLVDETGDVSTLTADQGLYTIELPGARCTDPTECFIGGEVQLLVEEGAPGDRSGLMPTALPTPTLAPTPPPPPSAPAEPAPQPTDGPPQSTPLSPSQEAGEGTEVALSQQWEVATTPQPTPKPLPTPLPPVTLGSIMTESRCLTLVLVGLGVFTISYGVQMALLRRRKR